MSDGSRTGAPALAVVTGSDAYVSPSFYATKAEHGRVVPTWNYSAVQLRGTIRLHDDVDWLRGHVRNLTDRNEQGREPRWSVDDAPEKYVEGQLRAIVGVELVIESVEAQGQAEPEPVGRGPRRCRGRSHGYAGGAGRPGDARPRPRLTSPQPTTRVRTS